MHMPVKILIVDDDPYILMSLDFLMKKSGYEVIIARNGTEAMELIETHLPHIVLLDIMMPDVDGYQICKHIKQTEHLKNIQVVFLSAKSNETDIRKGMDLGATLYITKPFSTREIVKQIKDIASTIS